MIEQFLKNFQVFLIVSTLKSAWSMFLKISSLECFRTKTNRTSAAENRTFWWFQSSFLIVKVDKNAK